MSMARCVLVVPCYNEARRFLAGEFRAFLSHRTGISVLFVNDGSTDDTFAVLKRLETEMPSCIEVLHLPQNSGKAEAVRKGMLHALNTQGITCVGFWDADLATPLDAVDELLCILADNPDIQMVFGSRVKLLGRNIERRAVRHYLGRVFATCASMVLRLPIYDTQCGAKLFRVTSDLGAVLQHPFQSRWIFDVEILARFQQVRADAGVGRALSGVIYEFPLRCWRDVPGSKLRPKDFLTAFRDLLSIHRRYPKKD